MDVSRGVQNGMAVPGDGPPLQGEAHQPPWYACLGLGFQRFAAHEGMGHFQVNQPSQGGLQGGVAGVHVLAVQVEGSLKTQGVAGGQATGLHPTLQQLPPSRCPPSRDNSTSTPSSPV